MGSVDPKCGALMAHVRGCRTQVISGGRGLQPMLLHKLINDGLLNVQVVVPLSCLWSTRKLPNKHMMLPSSRCLLWQGPCPTESLVCLDPRRPLGLAEVDVILSGRDVVRVVAEEGRVVLATLSLVNLGLAPVDARPLVCP
jgi:hypothetical protein